MPTEWTELVGAAGAIAGVLVGAGLQFLQTRRTHLWQLLVSEQAELRATGVAYLTATWQLAQVLTDAARTTDQPFAQVDAGEIRRLSWVMTEARTQLDLIGGEAVYGASKKYSWALLRQATAAEQGKLPAGANIDLDTVELRRTLMNQIRSDLGRPPVLHKWAASDFQPPRSMPG